MDINFEPQDLIRMNEDHHKARRESRKRTIEGVLQNVEREKLYSTVISNFRGVPRIETTAKKLILDNNSSTQRMMARRRKLQVNVHHRSLLDAIGKQSKTPMNLHSPEKMPGDWFSPPPLKTLSSRKQNAALRKPTILKRASFIGTLAGGTTSLSTQQRTGIKLSAKNRSLQQLFGRICHNNAFIYSVTCSKRQLTDFLTQQYNKKFAAVFCWFFDVRLSFDFKYYIQIGNKLLSMSPHEIGMFVYAVFEGFNHAHSFSLFQENFGVKDLIYVARNRQHLPTPGSSKIYFQKQSLNQLRDRNFNEDGQYRVRPKLTTVYRSTFLHKDLNSRESNHESDKHIVFRERLDGEISFEEYCFLFRNRIPNIFIDIAYRLFQVELVPHQLDETLKQRFAKSVPEQNTEAVAPTLEGLPIRQLLDKLDTIKNNKLYSEPLI